MGVQFGVNPNHVCSIIPKVCQAIYQVLQPHYLKVPATQEEWHQIANDYFSQWNFPMCIGVLDGKRIVLEKTENSEAQFYEHKGKISIVLLSVVDANYKFIYVDVGAGGALNAAGIWDRCSLKQALEMEKNVLNIPQIDKLPFSDEQCPFVLVGDDAFPLKGYLMKSYRARELTEERKIFNYRLSRARKSSENA